MSAIGETLYQTAGSPSLLPANKSAVDLSMTIESILNASEGAELHK
jgi:hypothetical protein